MKNIIISKKNVLESKKDLSYLKYYQLKKEIFFLKKRKKKLEIEDINQIA